ncbi:MAG: DUF3990 domain-containing protein [Clostridia bacterium]|nr:DUF3990 domain-containing protein [Clostridia bacterium]
MILYHGTTQEIRNPVIIRSEIGRDFGFAFYTTDIRPQAERWAVRKAKIQARREGHAVRPIVNVYEWNPETALSVKSFDGPSLDWLDMVVNCRSNPAFRHPYDIVIGKIANDSVGETVSFVVQGIMRREDAVERLRFEQINNQLAFCTEAALAELHFVSSYEVEV